MPARWFPFVPPAAVRAHVGEVELERAGSSARHRILELGWAAGTLEAVVEDDGPRPLRCWVALVPAPAGRHAPDAVRHRPVYTPTASGCSCPLASRCAHVAAAMIAASERSPDAPGPSESEPGRRSESSAGSRSGHGTGEAGAEWRAALRGVVGDLPVGDLPVGASPASASSVGVSSAGARAARVSPSEPAPLALVVELRERVRRQGGGRWGRTTETSRAATAASTGKVELTARIGAPGRKRTPDGGPTWVGAPFAWNTLHYRTHDLGHDPAQVRWFLEFETLARALPGRYGSGDGTRLLLDDYASPLLWRLLADAPARGILVVSGDRGGRLVIADGAEVRLTASADRDGDVVLTPSVEVDGRRVDAGLARPIGDHGLAVVEWDGAAGPVVTLAPLGTDESGRAGADRTLALARRGDIRVPAAELDDFAGEAYPVLSRTVVVDVPDGVLPRPEPPLLVLTVAFEAGETLRLAWHWEYRLGARLRAAPLHGSAREAASRDPDAEAAILEAVARALVDAPSDDAAESAAVADAVLRGADAAEWVVHLLPALEGLAEAGVRLRVDVVGERVDYRELTERPEITVSTVPTDRNDWFDLGVLVTVAGRTIPFQPLFSALARGARRLLLVDKSYLSLKRPEFDRLRELLSEADDLVEWETGPRISRYQASLWADFEDLADVSAPAVAWRETVGGLLEVVGAADAGPAAPVERTPLPAGLAAELRPYQRDGYDWLTFLWRHGLGGVLADDMGLGKTLQTLALIAHAREAAGAPALRGETRPDFRASGHTNVDRVRVDECPEKRPGEGAAEPRIPPPFLVVVPASVVATWEGEAARFTPGLRVASVTATRRKEKIPLEEAIAGADLVITTYAVFRLDHDAFAALPWSGLVLDEAQFVKNHASQAHRNARDLDAPFKLAVTGTPLENDLLELWALFAIVAPGLFPSRRRFDEEYVKPVAAAASTAHGTPPEHGAARLARLRRRIRPLMLRRTKELVAPELPSRQEQTLSIELHPRHRRLYDTWLQRERQKVLGLLDDLDRNRFIVFRSITLLRLLALDASLLDPDAGAAGPEPGAAAGGREAGAPARASLGGRGPGAAIPSAKLDALLDQLADVVAEGHRALVFSQFTSYLALAAERLEAAGIPHSYLDGATRRRAEVIRRFREGDDPVFLISLKAGGFGLTLTEADYVFLLDPWWNPAVEAQAVDRTHRIGQRSRVMVYRMVSAGTIEEKVVQLARRKAELFDAVMDDDGAFSSSLTADDIRSLLE